VIPTSAVLFISSIESSGNRALTWITGSFPRIKPRARKIEVRPVTRPRYSARPQNLSTAGKSLDYNEY
jgi:hypothetical protein